MKITFLITLGLTYLNIAYSQNLLSNGHLVNQILPVNNNAPPDPWVSFSLFSMCYPECNEVWSSLCGGVPSQYFLQWLPNNTQPTEYLSSQIPLEISGFINETYVCLGANYNTNGSLSQTLSTNLLPGATYNVAFYSSLCDMSEGKCLLK